MASNTFDNSVRTALLRIAKIHMLVGAFFAAQIIAYDAAKLITPEIVLKRWVIGTLLVAAALIAWYLARLNNSAAVTRNLVWFLVITDFIFASFMVYTTRGMASKAVFLFVLGILTAAALKRGSAIYFASAIAVLTYLVTAVAYFVLNFNEGYKIELYGEIGFYSALLLVIGWLTRAVIRTPKS